MTLDCDRWLQNRRADVDAWWDTAAEEVAEGRRTYSWPKGTPTDVAVARREELARGVSDEAARTGRLSRSTFAEILRWGFGSDAVLEQRTDEEIECAMKAGLGALAGDDAQGAAKALGRIPGVGVSRSTKVFGLVDPQRFAVYDSRVGNGLRDLRYEGRPMIDVPPGKVIRGTTTNAARLERGYAEITCLLRYLAELAQRDADELGVLQSPADVEMGLFMRGAPQ